MDVSPIIDAIVMRLREKLPGLQVEYFPERPTEFRLNHPVGAILISYPGSRFDKPEDVGAVLQTQTVMLNATIVFRQLNGRHGAVATLDDVCRVLGGFQPPNCQRKCWLVRDTFLGEIAGLWQYTLDFAPESVFIEDCELPNGSPLAQINYEGTEQ
ncbi:hypothetical protein CE143_17440 [Photorhabdus luminescens]|uniref:Gp37 protein n=1 Tax=Photorhabdus akhurstii TaxID=171438 RepID=A0ABX8M2K8_9GAMM|nr:Gp37 family protein [Photorhabdus akhurstii]QXF34749.1 hypothetical protein B0X70_17430 [Photorhabdus akhurstii]UJD76575.1 hypothetical protein CE143_17440 [Photorhabdus luminescens]